MQYTTTEILTQRAVRFGFPDDRGRECGYTVEITRIEVGENGRYWAGRDVTHAGTWFRVHGSPTRAGQSFGPSFNYANFETRAEAENHATKLIARCRKSYTKKFAPQANVRHECDGCNAIWWSERAAVEKCPTCGELSPA